MIKAIIFDLIGVIYPYEKNIHDYMCENLKIDLVKWKNSAKMIIEESVERKWKKEECLKKISKNLQISCFL